MIIWGISSMYHDAALTVLDNNKILFAGHSERYSREKNDAFFLIFAIPSMLCIFFGTFKNMPWLAGLGTGVAMYGFAYFVVHEVIIHQRIKWFTRSNIRYIKVLRWAHKMHHKHLDKHEGESFGMLYVSKKYWDKVKRDEAIQNNG